VAIISRKDLLALLRPAINELFEEVYADYNPELYIKEVDFGQDNVRNTRGSAQKVHSTPSGSDGSN